MWSRLLHWMHSPRRYVFRFMLVHLHNLRASSTRPCTQAVRANLQEAQRVAAGNGSEEDKLEARIEADVYEALQHALAH